MYILPITLFIEFLAINQALAEIIAFTRMLVDDSVSTRRWTRGQMIHMN